MRAWANKVHAYVKSSSSGFKFNAFSSPALSFLKIPGVLAEVHIAHHHPARIPLGALP